MSAQAFYTGDRARRQREHDEYTGGNMPRYRTTAWDHEMRHETVAVRGDMRTMQAKYPGTCSDCGKKFAAGTSIEWSSVTRKARHLACPEEKMAEPTNVQPIAARVRPVASPTNTVATVPAVGKYTVRPEGETVAVVVSIEEPTFGDFKPGTRIVSVHGSFVVQRGGLSESRSWLPFGIIHADGRLVLYKTARELVALNPNVVPAERQHERAKIILAANATRLMLTADIDTILTFGKAWASAEGKCFVCGHGLLDEESQRRGIGPVCLRRVRGLYGAE
jgi:hypothetical protein